jgi:hypothetical protein
MLPQDREWLSVDSQRFTSGRGACWRARRHPPVPQHVYSLCKNLRLSWLSRFTGSPFRRVHRVSE